MIQEVRSHQSNYPARVCESLEDAVPKGTADQTTRLITAAVQLERSLYYADIEVIHALPDPVALALAHLQSAVRSLVGPD